MKAIAVALLLISPALAQRQDNQEKSLTCDSRGNNGERERFCEMRETTLGATGRLVVDSKPNGGISIKGWSRNDVLVRAKVESWADSAAEARANVGSVRVETGGGNITAKGAEGTKNWSVSFEIFTPWRTDVEASTVNGGVTLRDLDGRIEFTTVNGGVNIARLSGDVKGRTQNGGLKVELDGSQWTGSGLNVQTTNGGVNLNIPAAYNASVETGTVNGRVSVDFPVNVPAGKIEQKQMAFNLGSGGAPIKVRTHNGSVSINKH